MEVVSKIAIVFSIVLVLVTCSFQSSNDVLNTQMTDLSIKDKYLDSSKKKVLMIGNSFTFYWNLPQVLERMFFTNGYNIEVDQITIGGSKLSDHWHNHIVENYPIQEYEYIVFNDHSTYPLTNIDTCAKYLKLFTDYAHQFSVKPFIYGTWEYPYLEGISSQQTQTTMAILDSLADLNQAKYVPVGEAFKHMERNHSAINLYMDDNKHPSPNATYLAACVFYAMITGESPIDLPRRFEGKNIDGKKIYYIITEIESSRISQKVANSITMDIR